MADDLKVYLDHLITRENLRYLRPTESFKVTEDRPDPRLQLRDLMGDGQRLRLLRKPDFQRSTWAWTPQECVDLLESFIEGRVIPSIIMWNSPANGYDYILDGGHRVSVVLAWLTNRWGRNIQDIAPFIDDPDTREKINKAAIAVENLVRSRIGSIDLYKQASERLDEIVYAGGSPKIEMAKPDFDRATFYQRLSKGDKHFHVLWVEGDYQTAEQSFLKINKSGRVLTEWETRIVEERDSSFMRFVMAVANPTAAPGYWPQEKSLTDEQRADVEHIVQGIQELNKSLFHPLLGKVVSQLTFPFMQGPPADRPRYVAEFLTVTAGYRGQEAEIEKLITESRRNQPADFIEDGVQLLDKALDLFKHLRGPSNQPLSLGIVPALYFYTEDSRYVRSLFYGFVYWMFHGSDIDIRTRKLLFSAFRGLFEALLIEHKAKLIEFISRNRGSGPEVTAVTADALNVLLEGLCMYKSYTSPEFIAYVRTKAKLDLSSSGLGLRKSGEASERRQISPREKSQAVLTGLIANAITCEICGGKLDPTAGTQYDHVTLYSQGGESSLDNTRISHPFCNHSREQIEKLQASNNIIVPRLAEYQNPNLPRQPMLFPDEYFEAP